MKDWKGTYEGLRSLVEDAGLSGEWKENERMKQFRASEGGILNWYPSTGTVQYQGSAQARAALEERMSGARIEYDTTEDDSAAVARERLPENKRVFVVHGHDDQAREQLELILHRLGLEPFVLANTSGVGLTIIEALEAEIGPGHGRARIGIVLLTPDDMGYAQRDSPEDVQPRARQNVVLEMGMLMAALKRENVVILKRGHVEVPSDAAGIIYLGFNDHVREVVPKLCERLRIAGFSITAEAMSRASA